MEGQSGAARVITSGGIHQQHVERLIELPYRSCQERAFAQRQESGGVGGRSCSLNGGCIDAAPGFEYRRPGPTDVARRSRSAAPSLEAHEHTGDAPHAVRRLKRRRAIGCKLGLDLSELGGQRWETHAIEAIQRRGSRRG